jgi:hypothetical protein
LYIEQALVDESEKLIESPKFKEKFDRTMEDEGRIVFYDTICNFINDLLDAAKRKTK